MRFQITCAATSAQAFPGHAPRTAKRRWLAIAFASLAILGASKTAIAGCRELLPNVQPGHVVLYEHGKCEGASRFFTLDENEGDVAWIGKEWNDRASSIIVGKGVEVTIYDNEGWGGKRARLFSGFYSNLGIYNDQISGLRIRKANTNLLTTIYENETEEDKDPNQIRDVLGEGSYNFGGNQDEFLTARIASRIWIPKGLKVTLYEGYSGSGRSEAFEATDKDRNLPLHPKAWGDRIKSVKVEKLPSEGSKEGRPKYVKMTGKWVLIGTCRGGNCGEKGTGITVGLDSGETISSRSELGAALSIMVGTEIKGSTGAFPGGEVTGKLEVTGTVSTSLAREVARSFMTSVSHDYSQKCNGDGDMWQWISDMEVKSTVGTLDYYTAYSKLFACPKAGVTPKNIHDIAWNGN